MPRPPKKGPKIKGEKPKLEGDELPGVAPEAAADAVGTTTATMEMEAEAPPMPTAVGEAEAAEPARREPAPAPVEMKPRHDRHPKGKKDKGERVEKAQTSAPDGTSVPMLPINIAKLQAMSMPDLNQMAKELGIENFGTMRKHEVIFHILQKNA